MIESITKKETQNKYIFWDLDGTLAPYRFNNHISDPNGTKNGISEQEIEDGIFLKRKPSRHMQQVLKTCMSKRNIIVGHYLNVKEINDKEKWLNKYYPNINDIIWVPMNNSKTEHILSYCNKKDISLDNIIFVDDVIKFLREAEHNKIESWHISSFLDWNYQKLD